MNAAREQALSNLKNFHMVMKKIGVPYALMLGTLLGLHRQGDFVEGDEDDIDLIIPHEFYHRILLKPNESAVCKELEEVGLTHPGGALVILDHKTVVPDGYPGGVLEGICIDQGRGSPNHMDLMRARTKGEKSWYLGRNGPVVVPYEFETDSLFPFKETQFLGLTVSIPNNPTRVLEQRYKEWQIFTPRHAYNYNSKDCCPNIELDAVWWEEEDEG
jgi:phosphorylcholine metabolism protein LicD